jgi:ATP-dependent helicase/DNAse subunit B
MNAKGETLIKSNRNRGATIMPIFAFQTNTRSEEVLLIKDKILEILEKNQDEDIAIIGKKHKSLEKIAEVLNQYNIPLSYERQENVLDEKVIEWIIEIFRFAIEYNKDSNSYETNFLVSKILRFPFWAIPSLTLYNIAFLANSQKKTWLEVMKESTEEVVQKIFIKLIDFAVNIDNNSVGQNLDIILGVERKQINDDPIDETE